MICSHCKDLGYYWVNLNGEAEKEVCDFCGAAEAIRKDKMRRDAIDEAEYKMGRRGE